MAGVLQHLRSSTLDKRPNPASMVDGQVAINYASGSPGMFFKDSNGDLVKVGPVHVGATAPNISPASGGTAGNSKGEQWLDTSGGTYVFKIWDGSAWRSEAGEFVNAAGDTMTGSLTMGVSANIIFEGSVDDGFETTLTVANPTADRTITLPNVTGTVVTTGDSGSVTSTMIADGTIVNADVNASAAIAGTKISPDFGSQNVITTGTSTAASFIPTSSTVPTNGVYLPAANSVALSTNGTGRLFVDASGRLLLGTGTAVSLGGGTPSFYVEGASASTANGAILRTNGASIFSLARGSSGNNATATCGSFLFQGYDGAAYGVISSITASVDGSVSSGSTPGTLIFNTTPSGSATSTERLRITSAGLVGIGTSAPGALLECASSATNGPVVRLHNSATSIAQDTEYGRLEWYSSDTSTGGTGISNYIRAYAINAGVRSALTFGVRHDSGVFEAMRLDNLGRLGIGTTSPGNPLSVVGYGNATGGWSVGNEDGNTSGYLVSTGSTSNSIEIAADPNNAGANSVMQFSVDGSERARIDSSGRLLVGTSSNSGGALLQVNGDRIRVATAKTPASATDTGTAGEICWDANYIYVCTATNTWKRTAIATW